MNKPKWEPTIPVPQNAPDAPVNALGTPTYIHRYENEQGLLYGYVLRYEKVNDKKKFVHLSYGNLDGELKWYFKGLIDRPLYNLKYLNENPDKPVLIVEGEKKADIAQKILNNFYCVITSMCGAKSANKTIWQQLKDRDITICGDNDSEGQHYVHDVVKFAKAAGAKSIRVVQLTDNFPPKWDLADSLPNGVTLKDIKRLLQEAQIVYAKEILDSNDKIAKIVKHPFRLTSTHVQIYIEKSGGGYYENISTRLEVLAMSCSTFKNDWGYLVSWKDLKGCLHKWILPAEMLFGDGRDAIKYLMSEGLIIFPNHEKNVKNYIHQTIPSKIISTFTQTRLPRKSVLNFLPLNVK
ncbi:MAG: DUF927 domain-containing protein, partial [Bdellovibrionota bacterium]